MAALWLGFATAFFFPGVAQGLDPPARTVSPASATVSAGIDLQWDAPVECPNQTQVRHDTARLLGQPLQAPRTQRISARARVRKNDLQNYELDLSLVVNDRIADETLIARSCTALGDATALKVALASDPLAVVAAIAPLAERPRTVEGLPFTGGRPHPSEPSPPPEAYRPMRVGLRLVGGAGWGPLPGAAPGVAFVASAQLATWRLELGAQAFGSSDAHYPALPDVGAHLQLFSGTVRACAMPRLGALQFPVCGGVEGGTMRGEGFGAPLSRVASSAWGALVLGSAIRLPVVHNWSLWLEGNAILPVVRPGFHFRNLDTLYVSPSGASRAWAGVEVELP